MEISRREMLVASIAAGAALIPLATQAAAIKAPELKHVSSVDAKIITGFPKIDQQLPQGFQRGSICLILGEKRTGKMTLVNYLKSINPDTEVVELGSIKYYTPENHEKIFRALKVRAIQENKFLLITQTIDDLSMPNHKTYDEIGHSLSYQRCCDVVLRIRHLKMPIHGLTQTSLIKMNHFFNLELIKNRYGYLSSTRLIIKDGKVENLDLSL